MIYTVNINTDLKINTLEDLVKLKPLLEEGTLKINKSQIARELGKDRRTIDKYIKGFQKSNTRKRSSNIDEYYDTIKELLSESNQQIFYYKSILWQYLADNHGLDCAESSFRRYILSTLNFKITLTQERKHIVLIRFIYVMKLGLQNKHS